MDYKRIGNNIVMRIDLGGEIVESILTVAKLENIKCGSVSAIGATNLCQASVFSPTDKKYYTKEYTGDYEITNLSGNLSQKDGEPYAHLHITLAGRDGVCVGGHLVKCFISLTCEIIIDIIDVDTDRVMNPNLGINQLRFK